MRYALLLLWLVCVASACGWLHPPQTPAALPADDFTRPTKKPPATNADVRKGKTGRPCDQCSNATAMQLFSILLASWRSSAYKLQHHSSPRITPDFNRGAERTLSLHIIPTISTLRTYPYIEYNINYLTRIGLSSELSCHLHAFFPRTVGSVHSFKWKPGSRSLPAVHSVPSESIREQCAFRVTLLR